MIEEGIEDFKKEWEKLSDYIKKKTNKDLCIVMFQAGMICEIKRQNKELEDIKI